MHASHIRVPVQVRLQGGEDTLGGTPARISEVLSLALLQHFHRAAAVRKYWR